MSTRIAVVGVGQMGQGIAVALLRGGVDVVLHDRPPLLQTCADLVGDRLRDDGNGTPPRGGDLGTLEVVDDLIEAITGCDYVLEAVPEDIELKVDLIRRIHGVAAPSTVILTNTSSVPVPLLREQTGARPLVAAHFFHPAEIVPGVEVSIADERDDDAALAVEALLARIGKHPVRVAPVPGFISNRLQIALFREAARCVDEGLATPEQVDQIVRSTFGLRLAHYGPFEIADMAGLHVFDAILANLADVYGDRFDSPSSLRELVDRGETGVGAGAGYHTYDQESVPELLGRRDARYRATLLID